MTPIKNFDYYNRLLEKYGSLLAPSQKKASELYYFYNLSLGEIGENLKISKTAAGDAITQSKKKLAMFEKALHDVKKDEEILSLVDKLLSADSKEIIDIINKIKGIISNGV